MSQQVINCSNCGAPLDYREGDAVAFCVYCNTITKLREIKKIEEHYTLEVSVGRENLRTLLVGDLLKVPGVPDSVRERLQIVEAKLIYVPYYVAQAHGNMKWKGLGRDANYWGRYRNGYRHISFHTKPESGEFDDRLVVILYAGPRKDADLENYEFATKGKRFYSIGEIKEIGAEAEEEQFDFEEARKRAINVVKQKHLLLLEEELEKVEDAKSEYEIHQLDLIHVPFWFITWKLAGSNKQYHAIIDAASGVTLRTDTPKSVLHWVAVFGVVLGFAAIGIVPFIFSTTGIFRSVFTSVATIVVAGAYAAQTIAKTVKTQFRERRG